MARQKKIVPYVPQTAYPKESGEYWKVLHKNRQNYTLEKCMDLLVRHWDMSEQEKERDNWVGSRGMHPVEWYRERFNRDSTKDANMWDLDSDGSMSRTSVRNMLNHIFTLTSEFQAIHDQFMAEYDSREDLQEVYRTHQPEVYYLYDRYGNSINNYGESPYYKDDPDMTTGKVWAERPESFRMFHGVVNSRQVKTFIEERRETPYQPGDLVRLRDPYVGHPDHDPMWANRYSIARGEAEPIPDKTTLRLGTVMKVTNQLATWRGTKGCKYIEVLWLGKEDTVLVEENKLRWEQRPTKANGLLK